LRFPLLPQAAALALREYPAVNSSLSPDQTSLLQHARCNLGVAMATPHGLAVPNIKDVQVCAAGQSWYCLLPAAAACCCCFRMLVVVLLSGTTP
jgi:hypothetical protein